MMTCKVIDIAGAVEPSVEGREVGEGRVVVRPVRDDEIVVNGVTLSVESSLASLRAACASYGISSSGGKVRCFTRLVNHQERFGTADNHSCCTGRSQR